MSRDIVESAWHDADEVAFYARAIDNYPDRLGEPSVGSWPGHPQNGFAIDYAGRVYAKKPDGRTSSGPPYDHAELAKIIKNGEDNPRKLSLIEAKLASKNRQKARGNYREFDKQTRAEGQTGVFGSVRAISFEAYYEGFES